MSLSPSRSNSKLSSPKNQPIYFSTKWQRYLMLLIPLVLTSRTVVFHRRSVTASANNLDCEHCLSALSRNQSNGYRKIGPGRKVLTRTLESFELELKKLQNGFAPTIATRVLNANAAVNQSVIQIRSFPKLNGSFPCYPPDQIWKAYKTQLQPAHKGLFYVRTIETLSTTVQGVAIRIAMKQAERFNRIQNTTYEICKTRFESSPASHLDFGNRNRQKSFLFAFVKEPTVRAVDMFFHYHVSRNKKEPTDAAFKRYLTKVPEPGRFILFAWPYDHYLHYLSLDRFNIGSGSQGLELLTTTVNKILEGYDFIGVTERLDESLVAMQMILGLKTSDILYNPAGLDEDWDEKGVYVQPSFVSQTMSKFFATDTWRELSRGDYLLYLAANASLDRTIEALGRQEFDAKLAAFGHAKELVMTQCDKILTKYSSSGRVFKTDCLYANAGCGTRCFNRLESEFHL